MGAPGSGLGIIETCWGGGRKSLPRMEESEMMRMRERGNVIAEEMKREGGRNRLPPPPQIWGQLIPLINARGLTPPPLSGAVHERLFVFLSVAEDS